MPDGSNDNHNDNNLLLTLNPFVLTCAWFSPGEINAFVEGIKDKKQKLICCAELLYYTGHPEQAHNICTGETEMDDMPTNFAMYLINALTAMTTGNVDEIMDIYSFLKSIREYTDTVPEFKKTVDFFSLYFNIMVHNTQDIVLPDINVDAFAVPYELKPMAIFAYAHYLIIMRDYRHAVGLCEAALTMMNRKNVIGRIYLSIIASIGYISCADWKRAEYYFRYAWSLALPDGIIMPFAEYRWMLSGMLEKCIRISNPDEYRLISELSYKYHKNWVKVHNSITGDTVSDKLTATEFNIAMLASKELSNTEIADFLEISVNSVRAHLRNIFNKLEIDSRKELKSFVIK
ncbi:MAG: helix-turn-helix transcriptional regulator [Clostridia bacterium]|nr:helix-turn-helix transcriptional regulator [Clostridia bacterium]